MEENANFVEPLFEKAGDYVKTSYDLFKLKTLDKTLDVVSTFFSHAVAVFVFTIFFLFVNIGVALWIGDFYGTLHYGFFALAFFYAILCAFIYLFMNNWIKKRVSNSILSQIEN
jgi:hypothetical protein